MEPRRTPANGLGPNQLNRGWSEPGNPTAGCAEPLATNLAEQLLPFVARTSSADACPAQRAPLRFFFLFPPFWWATF